MNRAIVTVAAGKREGSGKHFSDLLERFRSEFSLKGGPNVDVICYDSLPEGCPSHEEMPYAFKAYAVQETMNKGYTTILWADSSMYPKSSLVPLWDYIEREGYWFSNNPAWRSGQWCCDSALEPLGITREESLTIPEVVGGLFGLDLRYGTARRYIEEFIRLCKDPKALCGPRSNINGKASSDRRVLGHRHDQTISAVLIHKMKLTLTLQPSWYSDQGIGNSIITNRYVR